MPTGSAHGVGQPRRPAGWVVPASVVGAGGVVAYVSAWALAGVWRADYDPVSQSISALYAQGAPPGPARLVAGALVASGVLLLPFAGALHRALPGRSTAGPIAMVIGGVTTAALAGVPCSPGCPGLGATSQDSMHILVATIAYAALVAAPVLFGLRLRRHDDRLAAVSLGLGLVAAAGLGARAVGVGVPITGLLQRTFNTIADAWYVLAAVVVIRRARGGAPWRADTGSPPARG